MITVLKDSPKYSIDGNGIVTITTTWMLIPEGHMTGIEWYEFGDIVNEWIGNIGDNYKMPTIKEGQVGREITEFTESSLFKVTDISYECVAGRTHYEVTYTNTQNIDVMRMEGNVSAQIDNTNAITKTVNYIVDVQTDDPKAIDVHFIRSGDTVIWAGDTFKVSDSSYNAQSKTRYSIGITASDMSVMKVGNTEFSTDGFGQRVAKATWRYSTEAYAEWEAPTSGDDASVYLGLSEGSGYIVSNITAAPEGVLGYNVTIDAVHVSKRHVSTSYREYKGSNSNAEYKTSSIRYQSDAESLADFSGIINDYASEFGRDDERITEVNVSESSRNNYEINITTTNEFQTSSNIDSKPKAHVTMSQGELVLDEAQCGWFKGLSGELYQINFPPTTRFRYMTTPESLIQQDADTDRGDVVEANQEAILIAIRGGMLGFDRVDGVQVTQGDTTKWLSKAEMKVLTSLDNVTQLMMSGYVYAQPSMTETGKTLRSIIFKAWDIKKDCPIYFKDYDDKKDPAGWKDGRAVALKRKLIGYKVKFCECSVDITYKGDIVSALRKSFEDYYKNALKYIKSDNFTSYKGINVSMNESSESGDIVTQVTCTIQALLKSNAYAPVWNSKYDDSFVM